MNDNKQWSEYFNHLTRNHKYVAYLSPISLNSVTTYYSTLCECRRQAAKNGYIMSLDGCNLL